jgi:hypothetical protein
MATRESAEPLVVLESFVGRIRDEDRFFRAGELIRLDDPAVKKWPKMFGPVIYRHDPPVESATAAPGEKRGA